MNLRTYKDSFYRGEQTVTTTKRDEQINTEFPNLSAAGTETFPLYYSGLLKFQFHNMFENNKKASFTLQAVGARATNDRTGRIRSFHHD